MNKGSRGKDSDKGSDKGNSGKGSGKDGPLGVEGTSKILHKKTSTTKEIKDKIAKIKKQIENTNTYLKKEHVTTEDKQKYRVKMNNLLDELRTLERHQDTSAPDKESLRQEIDSLETGIAFPNRRQPQFSHEGQQMQQAAAQVLMDWEHVTPGVSLNDLSPEVRTRLEACTTTLWSPFKRESDDMVARRATEDPTVLTARVNFAMALYMSMVPQFCGQDIPNQEAVQGNTRKVRDLLECIALVACTKCQEAYNPIFVFAEAAFKNPLQFLKDAAGGGFAVGVLAEMAGPKVVGAVSQLPGAAFTAASTVAQNPLVSFTTYKATMPYIKGLLEQVFGERFGHQERDHEIQGLFDELSAFYLTEGVTDIIGFPPADVDSVRNKLGQMLYTIGYRGVASMQSTGGIIKSALHLPQDFCSSAMSAASAIKRWWCGQGMRLLDRYKFIPEGTEGGLFESILACLDNKRLLEDTDINDFVIAFLKHNEPTTVFRQSVEHAVAADVMAHGPLIGSYQTSDSLLVNASQENPNPDSIEHVGLSSGPVPDSGNIYGESNVPSSRGVDLGEFRRGLTPLQQSASRQHVAARRREEEDAAAAARPGARGGDLSSLFNSSSSAPNSYRGFARGGLGGGRSRSRKHSVSKRTRRKGVAKKQKSKKNKRQSRRKVRRASSRK